MKRHRILAAALALAAMFGAVDANALKGNMAMLAMMKQLPNAQGRQLLAMLKVVKMLGPKEYGAGWTAAVEKTAAGAHKGDAAAIKAGCAGCHDKYRDSYRNKFGSKAGGGKGDDDGPPIPVER